MRVWLITCLFLFALAQFYQWVRGFIVPLPIYILAGAFLSIASNYDRGSVQPIFPDRGADGDRLIVASEPSPLIDSAGSESPGD
jgi:hypothetical protein